MASQIEIVSNAMILIGANPISSLTEGTEGLVASALYENTYTALIASHSWRFATKQKQLSQLVDAPLKDFKYQYQLPSDMITMVRVQSNTDYEIYGDKLYSDQTEIYIDYRYRLDETLLPPYYTLTLQFLLAAQFAIPVTDNSKRAQVYEGLYEAQLKRAKYIDSSARPQTAIVDSPLTGIN
jgi:hypothetical protein